jgi:hypothetical protein
MSKVEKSALKPEKAKNDILLMSVSTRRRWELQALVSFRERALPSLRMCFPISYSSFLMMSTSVAEIALRHC